jgi:outer membrane protein assembly factor BamB
MISRLGLLALAAVAPLVLGGCETLGGAYDRLLGGRPARKPAELVPIQPSAALKIRWQANVGPAEKSVFFPALAGNVLYAAGAAGSVSGFDAASGALVVRLEAGGRISGGVGAGAGLVVLGTPRGEVLALGRDGKLLWKAQVASEVLAPPAVAGGLVVVRSGDGRLYGLDVVDGKRRWLYQRTLPPLSVRAHAGLVIHRGGVFAGFAGGRLVALALENGHLVWEGVVALPRGATELERIADVTSLPAFDERQVCAVAFQGRLACFELESGTLLWTRDVSSIAGLALDSRYLYVTDERSAVIALDKTNGASIWRQDKLAGRGVGAPLPLGRFVVVGDAEGYVHLISREDGAFAARIATDGSAIAAPPLALDASSFVVQTRNGGVFAIAVQ